NAGNPDLAPELAWVYEAAIERPVFGKSKVTATLRHYELSDVVDLVPVEGFAAPGNIGDGTRQEIELLLSLPLENLGRLQLSGLWRNSEVIDPVTGDKREISGEPGFEGGILYTLEVPSRNSTFGIRGELTSKETSYRLSQIITTRNESYWRVYWDWRAAQNLNYRFQVENPTSRDRWRNRIRYDGLRSDDIIESRERRSAVLDPMLVVRVQWTF
ncbi:MAG: TonB-dependent receptor, partial [Gammaproteobacteria bacterium]|nr:TonB-dependent receptor [Gammaproteobacteria bacterium]